MTTSLDLLGMAYAAVTDQPDTTDAGNRVYQPGDVPTQDGQYPLLKLRIVRESRQSLGRGGPPEFTTLATLRFVGEVSAPAVVSNGGATAAEAALWALKGQVEVAVINSYPLFGLVQQLASIESQFSYSSEAETHLAGIQIDMTFEFYEGPEDFATIATDDLDEINITATDFPATGTLISTL